MHACKSIIQNREHKVQIMSFDIVRAPTLLRSTLRHYFSLLFVEEPNFHLVSIVILSESDSYGILSFKGKQSFCHGNQLAFRAYFGFEVQTVFFEADFVCMHVRALGASNIAKKGK